MKIRSLLLTVFLSLFVLSCQSPMVFDQATLAGFSEEPAMTTESNSRALTGLVLNVKNYGAMGNGTTMDTLAIQRTIDALPATGGTVLLTGGTFLSATVRLKSHTTFYIDTTATLRGSHYYNDYPYLSPPTLNGQLLNCRRALIYTESATDVTITGGGTIDGQNQYYDRAGYKEAYRPMAIFTTLSDHVTYSNFKVVNPAMWGVVSMETTDLLITGLNITTSGITRDGIDLIDSMRAVISNNVINSGDDGICLKTHNTMGLIDILVKNNTVQSNCNALKFGTPTYGPIQNVVFQDITIKNTRISGIAVEAIDGSDMNGVTFQRITMDKVGSPFFVLLGNRGSTPTGLPAKIGSITNLTFKDITVTNTVSLWGNMITGTIINGVTYKPSNILFDNVKIAMKGGATTAPGNPPEYAGQYPEIDMWGNLPGAGLWIRHVNGIRFVNSSLSLSAADARKPIVQTDVTGYSWEAAASTTTVRVHKDVGYGNSIYVRGSQAPLSWTTGIKATWTTGNVWVYTTNLIPTGIPFEFKALKNNTTYETGANHPGVGGKTLDIYPAGY